MSKRLHTILAAFICLVNALPAAAPDEVATKAQRARALFDGVSSSAYCVQLMVITSEIFVEPPPDARSFESVSRVAVTIESGIAYKLIHLVLSEVDATSWRKETVPGYPRAYWQIRGPRGQVVLDFLIDEDHGIVGVGEGWFKVSDKLIALLTAETVRLGCEALARRRTPEKQPNQNK